MSLSEGVAWAIGGLCQIAILVFEVYWCYKWWDTGGLVVGILGGPIIALVFPFLFWIKEGFSLLYFGLWTAGIVVLTYAGVLKKLREGTV